MSPVSASRSTGGAGRVGLETAIVAAFAAARSAQTVWAARALADRLAVIRRFRHLVAAEGMAVAGSVDRPAAETLSAQVIPLGDACRFLEREAASILRTRRLGVSGRPAWLAGVTTEVVREPLGVVLVIAPTNYPVFIPGVQMAQSLAAGNAVVVKPGVGGEPAARALGRLLVRAGLDPRLVAVLDSSTETAVLAMRQGPDRVLLTGSLEAGRSVLRESAARLTPCTLELSGSDAVVVRRDADLERVVAALRFGWRLNGGATCIAPRRVFVDSAVAGRLESRLATVIAGEPSIPVPARQAERLLPLLLAARARGAVILGGGEGSNALGLPLRGPLVVTRARTSMRLLQEDVFAPVLALVETAGDDEAVREANQSPWALGASVFSGDREAAWNLGRRLRAGVVTINDLIVPTADPRVPFGGSGASGFGVTRGAEGLLELTRPRVMAVRRGRWLPHLEPTREGDERFFSALLEATHGASLGRRVIAGIRAGRLAWRRRNRPLAG